MKSKKGFTLVELLAVIAILAILVIIALPSVVRMFTEAKKNTFITEVKTVYRESASKFISESSKGNKLSSISSGDDTKLDMSGENLDYCVILDNQGKVKKLAVGNNSYYMMLSDINDIESITKDDVKDGKLENMKCDSSAFKVKLKCKYDGNLKQGAEYVNGQYTYKYMQEVTSSGWRNASVDGWGVALTDKNSAEPVTTDLCTTINDKPIVSMSYMFSYSKTTSVDLSSFNTSNVINMNNMFSRSSLTSLDLSGFDTSNVTNMANMFTGTSIESLDLKNIDTKNVVSMSGMFSYSKIESVDLSSFNTSKVTDMSWMFYDTQVASLDLSNFDTSNVTNTGSMFYNAKATTGLARTQVDADKFNSSSNKPSGLTFKVK